MHHGPALIDGSPEGHASRLAPPEASAAGAAAGADPDIRLTLPANAENVVLVRHVVALLAEALELPRRLVDDAKLAVTEACTNVVRHAYGGASGTLDVQLQPLDDGLTVIVADTGRGLSRKPGESDGGLGLPLMAALANSLEIDQPPARGSCVRMSFRHTG